MTHIRDPGGSNKGGTSLHDGRVLPAWQATKLQPLKDHLTVMH